MRVGFISDIHTDINSEHDVVAAVAKAAKDAGCQLLIVAGDIRNGISGVKSDMEKLRRISGIDVRYVPGNHDMWKEEGESISTDSIYQSYLDDPFCLCGKVLDLGKWAVVGDIGWYDYSFGEGYSREEYDQMKLGERVWQDSIKNDWTKDNFAACQKSLDRLESLLEQCEGKNIIAVTHMLPIKEFCPDPALPPGWAYFNAFLGSEKLAELYEKYNVKTAVCGHVHYRTKLVKNGVEYICPCLNYSSQWFDGQDPYIQARQTLVVTDIDC